MKKKVKIGGTVIIAFALAIMPPNSIVNVYTQAKVAEAFTLYGLTIPDTYSQNKLIQEIKHLPVLTFHGIDAATFGAKNIFISPTEFEHYIQYLADMHYNAITFGQLNDVGSIPKPVMITFDDGYENVYTYAYPVLKKYGIKATVFLTSDQIGNPRHLDAFEIKAMSDLADFQSHTKTHSHLIHLTSGQLEEEMSISKKRIESITCKDVFVIAYPYGEFNEEIINTAGKYYTYGVKTEQGDTEDLYTIRRISINKDTNFDSIRKLLLDMESHQPGITH